MKAILINDLSPEGLSLFADSAIGRPSMPLFVPRDFGPWTGSVRLAVRVGRLGKGVAEKFAFRYIDALTAVHVMQSEKAGGLGFMADSAVIQGDFVPFDPEGGDIVMEVSQTPVGEEPDPLRAKTSALGLAQLDIPRALALVTRLATVKTGDLLIFPAGAVATNLEDNKDTYISASVNRRPCIKFKVK